MEHVERSGAPKLVQRCTLPLTGTDVIDFVITDLGVFEFTKRGGPLVLKELARGVSLDEVREKTAARFENGLT
jgi:acyl CoA:acetate/3-ketoacid CoA transferase beta subunit